MGKTASKPTSFRLPQDVIDAIELGADRFNMSRTDWIAFLAKAAVSDTPSHLVYNESELTVQPKRRPILERLR